MVLPRSGSDPMNVSSQFRARIYEQAQQAKDHRGLFPYREINRGSVATLLPVCSVREQHRYLRDVSFQRARSGHFERSLAHGPIRPLTCGEPSTQTTVNRADNTSIDGGRDRAPATAKRHRPRRDATTWLTFPTTSSMKKRAFV